MTFKKEITSVFDVYGIKKVSKTDKSKHAYVLNKEQLAVLKKAGKKPGDTCNINILGDASAKLVKASYYHAKRKGSGRSVEPRMGTDFIREWLTLGDELLLATDGSSIYAVKLNNNSLLSVPSEEVTSKVLPELSDALITKRAKNAIRKARKTKGTTDAYYRDPYVIEAAKRRAKGKCEMPGCKYKAFITASGKPYLEGHHVKPLAEGGDDSIKNVAALCPVCHREQHYSKDKLDMRKILLKHLRKIIKK